MSKSEQTVGIAAKLYDARKAMKFLYGERFQQEVAEYRPYIESVMQRLDKDTIHAGMHLLETLQKTGASGVMQAMVLATIVEMIEPSPL